MSLKNEGEIRLFSYIQNMKESTTSQPTLQEILKDILQAKAKRYWIKIWRKSAANGNYISKYVRFFSYYINTYKGN